jgi:hypothetical protein
MNKGKFFNECTFALCNHPTDDELSPKLEKHSSGLDMPYKIDCQTVMTKAGIPSSCFYLIQHHGILVG